MSIDFDYQTGLLWQDTQHEEWINSYIELKKAMEDKQDQALFEKLISFLVMYVNHHFNLEQEYMTHYDYPEKKFHMEDHRLYILRLKDFREKYRGYSETAALKIIEEMTNWIYSHILENDKKLGYFILEKERNWIVQKS
ncbi:MAG: hemerythrin family protein [Pseudomonadota bacterium]